MGHVPNYTTVPARGCIVDVKVFRVCRDSRERPSALVALVAPMGAAGVLLCPLPILATSPRFPNVLTPPALRPLAEVA